MPKIANLRNHQGADTNASTRGFISKLQLGSKYTRHSGARTWTPKWFTAGVFMGWAMGFSEGVEEFLKFCLHSDMGLSRAWSSVLILIWGFLPLAWAVVFWYWIPCWGHSAVFSVKFSSSLQGPKMAVLAIMLNLRWNGLNFSPPPHFPLSEKPKEGPNHGSPLVSEWARGMIKPSFKPTLLLFLLPFMSSQTFSDFCHRFPDLSWVASKEATLLFWGSI